MNNHGKGASGILENIRRRIDEVDRDILMNLEERLELSLQTRRMKSRLRDPDREKSLLDALRSECDPRPLLDGDFVSRLFKEIVDQSRSLQKTEGGLIGFQGEHGAYGEEAARRYDPSLIPIPCRQFEDVFQSVAAGRLDFGLIPVQNTLGGPVMAANELLLETPLMVTGEVILPIRHCLLAIPKASHREIRVVHSHPQALSQCREFLSRHNLTPRPCYDTAGAARKLALDRSPTEAAVAGRLCADLYHLEIIKPDIQDRDPNLTRFLVMSREEKRSGADKCSLLFSIPHAPGALLKVLEIFAGRDINLTRIESFSGREDPGRPLFFCDFRIPGRNFKLDDVLSEVRESTSMMKYLGLYKEQKCE